MKEPDHSYILVCWNLAGLFFGGFFLGLSVWPLLGFMAFMNASVVHLLVTLWQWQKYAKALEASQKEKVKASLSQDFETKMQEEINRRYAELLRELAEKAKSTKKRTKFKAAPDEPFKYPPRGKPINNVMKLYGLNWGYTQQEVNDAYRRLVKKYHPDLHGGDDKKIKQVNAAKDWLDMQIKQGLNDNDV